MPALGGYLVPPTSTFGSQVQRSSSGTLSMTMATWEPQPHHVDLPGRHQPGSHTGGWCLLWCLPQLSQVAFLHILLRLVCMSLVITWRVAGA